MYVKLALMLWVSVCFGGSGFLYAHCAAVSLDYVSPVNSGNNNNYNVAGRTGGGGSSSECSSDRLAIYKVVLHTYWTRELFPKHYPDWRPSAQWTKSFGRVHDSSFKLFRLGEQASAGMKAFAETGRSDGLDVQTSADSAIFDEFNLPAISSGGSGRAESKFFVDGNHSLVSVMTRIVPSPDWFIGIDSFQLCVGQSWIDSVTVELDPLDAGTDNGFTFTAPNWPTEPQGIIYRITARYPGHPAGSFFYPQSKRLPPIATFQFLKLKEYELSEVFHHSEDDRKYETLQTRTRLVTEHNHVEMNNELSASIERERQYEVAPQPIYITEQDRIRARLLAKLKPTTKTTATTTTATTVTNTGNNRTTISMPQLAKAKNDKNTMLGTIANRYAGRRKHRRGGASMASGGRRQLRDCRVGHWSSWSACSKTCGIGEMQRHRKVIKPTSRGGLPCPPLQESKWCGSAKDCTNSIDYFKW